MSLSDKLENAIFGAQPQPAQAASPNRHSTFHLKGQQQHNRPTASPTIGENHELDERSQ